MLLAPSMFWHFSFNVQPSRQNINLLQLTVTTLVHSLTVTTLLSSLLNPPPPSPHPTAPSPPPHPPPPLPPVHAFPFMLPAHQQTGRLAAAWWPVLGEAPGHQTAPGGHRFVAAHRSSAQTAAAGCCGTGWTRASSSWRRSAAATCAPGSPGRSDDSCKQGGSC